MDQPKDLEVFMEKIDKNGERISAKNAADNKTPPKPLLPRWINNILVIISTVVSTLLAFLVLVLLTKHFKIKSLLATLVLSTLPPPPQAMALRHNLGQLDLPGHSVLKPLQTYSLNSEIETYTPNLNDMCKTCKVFQKNYPVTMDPTESKDWSKTMASVESKTPAEPRKVVCSYPITTMWSNVLGTIVICYAIIRYIKPMTWYRGYKYCRVCRKTNVS